MSKLFCLAAAIFYSACGFTQTSELADGPAITCMKKKPCVEPFEQGMELPCGKYPCAYNAPAGICLRNGWDFNISGSFIYWYARQDDMEIARVTPTLAPEPQGGAIAYQRFNYEPGFKLGLGYNTDYDSWALKAEYTWLHETVSTGTLLPPPFPSGLAGLWTLNDWFVVQDDVSAVSSTWNLKLDMVDAGMSRSYYQGTRLTMKPFGGLRALWLRQKMTIQGYDGSDLLIATSSNRSNSWAIGPAAGVGAHWLLGCGFRLEGDAMGSLLYTRYTKISVTESHLGEETIRSSVHGLSAVRPIAQLSLGLGWGRYFYGCNNDYYLDLSLDYEFLEFWSQNMMRNFDSNLLGTADDIGDLQMHGLTATVRFDF